VAIARRFPDFFRIKNEKCAEILFLINGKKEGN
jgi:hypothetical protein